MLHNPYYVEKKQKTQFFDVFHLIDHKNDINII